jgi:hypothetical protein
MALIGRYLGPGVHDVDEAAVVICLADGLQHALVLQAAGAEAGERLTAPAHRRLRPNRAQCLHQLTFQLSLDLASFVKKTRQGIK